MQSSSQNVTTNKPTPRFLCSSPIGWRHNAVMAVMAVVCLSVCLSVCPVPDPKSRVEGHSKLKIGWKESRDTGDP